MRVWGRIKATRIDASTVNVTADTTRYTADSAGADSWVEVQTDANGNNDLVYLTAFIQALLLNLNESPFYAASGIPAQQSVIQQIFPDYYVALTQQIYSQFFASLIVTKQATPTPTYDIKVVTHAGVILNATVPIPT